MFTVFLVNYADIARFSHNIDANGNCETKVSLFLASSLLITEQSIDVQIKPEHPLFIVCPLQINQGYLDESQLMSLTATSPEQEFLLERSETCSDQSKNSNDTFMRTEVSSSYESIHALQSTATLQSQQSALSEPMSLLSNTDHVPCQTSMSTQSSSQPTSPQIITPLAATPHVNVNITFHIGNGSVRTPSVIQTDSVQDSQLPFGEEEESFSMPQQEAGKQSVTAVQESGSMCEDFSA